MFIGVFISERAKDEGNICLSLRDERWIASGPIWPLLEFRQQDNTLLFVGIGARDDRHAALCITQIVRQMRHIGGDVEKVPGAGDEMMLQFIAIPTAGFAAQDIDGCFVVFVLMRF